MTKKELLDYLLENTTNKTEYSRIIYTRVNDQKWTLAELFIRQYLNNGCDGFEMTNVEKVYEVLKPMKEKLIEWNLLSEVGYNNSGFPLWTNYNF